MYYYELNVSGIINDYQIGVKSNTECKTMYEVICQASQSKLFDNEEDKESVLSYSILSEKEFKENYL